MSGRWFRFYDEAVNDPKVQRLPAPLFRFWVNTLCLASKNGGALPSRSDMEFALRLSESQLSELIGKLVAAELLDVVGETLAPHNWNGRQYKSDVSTDRVKRFRERHETVSVTPPETEQRQSRTETDSAFEVFYAVCPKKVKEREARDQDVISISLASSEIILAGMRRYASAVAAEKTEPRFIATPAKWLAGERWKDGSNCSGSGLHPAFTSPEEIEGQRLALEKARGH